MCDGDMKGNLSVGDEEARYEFVLVGTKAMIERTRPDTRPPVADGWAGAETCVFTLFDSIITNGRTDGRTKPLIELRVRY